MRGREKERVLSDLEVLISNEQHEVNAHERQAAYHQARLDAYKDVQMLIEEVVTIDTKEAS